ncbi:ABC transporter ATP-binding protein [Desulforhopalus singaporensis]|uniref:ABC-2 type transport system ATP-binding protein n=1 Tax=Desulforhopalus singaporensis TaxID=91360 RepID=A0A1H0JXC3_9BACT|nr:ABC transporter ATP-binding protein [Desulforhopalus singaporensis]SDO48438.1 ABC-2 type transport system ATP-binding protein [Desulforhopalus singaporensis]
MIQASNIIRKYGDFAAVNDISFTVKKGEIVGLLGHNGAGKTTIMKMLTGYLEPTGGTIKIDGLSISENRSLVQKKIGYLPENCPVYPEMTILGYLDFAASLRGIKKADREPLIIEAVRRTALKEKATAPIATLSRGYRQRTGVAQAILHKPEILILDEPTNGLDPTQIQQMRSLITELAKNSTVIISTHILQEVQAICDRVIIVKNGKIALDSPFGELNKSSRLLIRVGAHQDDVEPLVTTITGVKSVAVHKNDSVSGPGATFALTLESNGDRDATTAELARTVNDQGWDLYSMHFEARNLETVFAEISE